MFVSVIATPGNTTSHHGRRNAPASAPPSMLPQLGVGGGPEEPDRVAEEDRREGDHSVMRAPWTEPAEVPEPVGGAGGSRIAP
jgi:hypothetical protein